MGELSHCLLYQISFMEVGVKVPEGVEYPARPVDTGQSYRSSPSKKTVIFWLVLSMLMRTVDATGFVAFDAAWVADPSDFSPHTFALSFHVMPAISHSFLVRGWLKVSAASELGMVSASWDADPHALALSFHATPALLQSNLVKGWLETSPEFAIHTFAFSSHAIAVLSQSTRVKGWGETSSAYTWVAMRLPMIRNVKAKNFTSHLLEHRLRAETRGDSVSVELELRSE
jgi:hypothetical protein